ncbi:hypothetical protein TNCV_25791 [Trichonephila clavipes]|uniref:Uncharacterized protein n=1 Tax=Trichonephila clavipes TaxID=2585209 RepID=A0A8X6W1K4_TRICX|nr:hypothetical protein TNCV_25791 [Trichonephila clavipes]
MIFLAEREGELERGKKGTSAAEENDRVMSIPAHVPKWNVEHSHLCLTAVLHGHSQVYRTRVTSRLKNVSVVAKSEGTKSKGKTEACCLKAGFVSAKVWPGLKDGEPHYFFIIVFSPLRMPALLFFFCCFCE